MMIATGQAMSKYELDVWQVWVNQGDDSLDHGLYASPELAKGYCETMHRRWGSDGEILWKPLGSDCWHGGDIIDLEANLRVFTIRKRGITILDESGDFITTEKAYFRLIARISEVFAKFSKAKGMQE